MVSGYLNPSRNVYHVSPSTVSVETPPSARMVSLNTTVSVLFVVDVTSCMLRMSLSRIPSCFLLLFISYRRESRSKPSCSTVNSNVLHLSLF